MNLFVLTEMNIFVVGFLSEKISNDNGDQLATAMTKPRTSKKKSDTACTRQRIKFFTLSKLGRGWGHQKFNTGKFTCI